MSVNKASPNDIFVWSDGTWCYREDYWEMTHMSDDFYVLFENNWDWEEFILARGVL